VSDGSPRAGVEYPRSYAELRAWFPSDAAQNSRVAEQRDGQREPLAHPERERARAVIGCLAQTDKLEHLADTSARDASLGGQRPEMVTRRAPAVKRARLEHDPT